MFVKRAVISLVVGIAIVDHAAMTNVRTKMIFNLYDFLDNSLKSIEDTPKMWGSPESIELQYLLLLQTKLVANQSEFQNFMRNAEDDINNEWFMKKYLKFLNKNFDKSNTPLHKLCEGDIALILKYLKKFKEKINL